jgi:ferredoxin
MLPEDQDRDVATGASATLVVRLARRKHTVAHHPGRTILEAARSAGPSPPSSCEAGTCATCLARLDEGAVTMRANDALSPEEVADRWILTCQAVPASARVVVDDDW